MQVGDGRQHREIGSPISTDNASWRGPNTETGGKSVYNNVQVGVGRRNKFYENIISVPLPSKE
ncbi:nitrogen fixation protein NifR [Staphylococcus aureus]|nr:nitrogen fixation protein NifR [Staphylococcus aureus]